MCTFAYILYVYDQRLQRRVGCHEKAEHRRIWDARLMQHTNALQHTATYCCPLQHTAALYNTLLHTATYCCILQHTAAHCCTLLYTATHCKTLQHTAMLGRVESRRTATCCNTLLHTALRSHVQETTE